MATRSRWHTRDDLPRPLGLSDDIAAVTTPLPTDTRCWLVKSEPSTYAIDDLAREGKTAWEGIRNYQARNFMRDNMRVGDAVLFYHSNADPPAVVGVAKVASTAYTDPSAFDRKSPYFDAKSKPEAPRWLLVDLAFIEKLATPIPLAQLREDPKLDGMLVTLPGQRLSVQPVTRAHFDHIIALAGGAQATAKLLAQLDASA